jgi:glycosyltransferase involved in cell wall biosynthesis
MKLVLICHPNFSRSQSMPRFAGMLKAAYESRGHSVEVWSPSARVFNWVPERLSKWAGYVDQYLLFPMTMRTAVTRTSRDTLFVFCDQALGPWVPLVRDRPHVVHVHDLLALRSALGDIPENPTGASGRLYQRYIRRGFRQGSHFISVSKKTLTDLNRFGGVKAATSEVVYNGMNFPYAPLPPAQARTILESAGIAMPEAGMVLHVGGGQWYKNLTGVVAIYAEYVSRATEPLPLWCVSPEPSSEIRAAIAKIPQKGRVVFLGSVESATLQALYSGARVFLFPSLAEGFGWPLVEAQACGCPVITTDEAPMNEVAGAAACYLPRLAAPTDIEPWARHGAVALQGLLSESPAGKAQRREAGLAWAKRFDQNATIDAYLAIYERVLHGTKAADGTFPVRNQSMEA